MPVLAATAAPAESDRARWAGVAAICLFSALVGRFCFLARPFDADAAIFVYMGKMVCEGGRLCHDMVDNKFPTVGLMMSVLWRTLGVCWPAYIALQTCMALASAVILGRVAARHGGSHAFWPTTLFMVVFLNFSTSVFGGFQLETAMVFFVVLAARSGLIAIAEDRLADSFVAGLCAGCAAMFKPTGLGVLAALGGAMWIARRQKHLGARALAHAAVAAIGVAIPLLVGLIYVIKANLLADMPGLWRQISMYASQSVFTPIELIKPLVALTLMGFPLVVRGWINRRHRGPATHWPAAPVLSFALLWLGVELAGVIMQRRMYAYHFLPLVPPTALLFGLLPRVPRPAAVLGALLPMMLLSVQQAGGVISTLYCGMGELPASRYLAAHTEVGDSAWLEYWPRTMLETGLKPGARYPFTFLFCNYDTAGVDYARQMIADFERIKPKYIFLPVPLHKRLQHQADFVPELAQRPVRRESYLRGWEMIEQYTLSHYQREAVVDENIAYRRKADAAVATASAGGE